MTNFSLLVLGSGSALPTVNTNQSAQLLNLGSRSFLIDCGEGTQTELRRNKVKIQQIAHIFISHLHGDHYFGLVGLLSSMQLLGRRKAIHIYAPEGLKEIVQLQLEKWGNKLSYQINFHLLDSSSQLLHEDSNIKITTLPLKHRVPCFGFLFQEKKGLRKFKLSALKKYHIPVHARKGITEGKDFTNEDGERIANDELTDPPPKPRSYAYCSDTTFYQVLIDQLPAVDLLYHEATFLDKDLDLAKKTFHSTAKQAAKVAALTGAKRLIIGHFSNRYKSKIAFANEARRFFSATDLAEEGKSYFIGE